MHDADRRIDDALRGMVRVEASRDFAARVRARVEADGAGSRVWPRAGAVAALALVVVAAVVWVDRPSDPPQSRQIARKAAPPTSLAPTARGEQKTVPRGGTFEAPAAPAVALADLPLAPLASIAPLPLADDSGGLDR